MNQIDEIWILFLVIVIILIVVFVVLRQAHSENYDGNVADVPKFKSNKTRAKVSSYEEIDDEPMMNQQSIPVVEHFTPKAKAVPKPAAPQPTPQNKVQQKSPTFDKDVTDPSVYLFRPQIRLPSKTRQQEGADLFRGDLHIKPVNRNGHFQSRYGSEGLRHDTMFNSVFAEKYNQLTGYDVVNEELLARQ